MKYGHHDARGNCEFIADNLILLQDHLSGVNVICPDCITKHAQAIRAYATEGYALDHASDVMELLEGATQIADYVISNIASCVESPVTEGMECKIKSKEDLRNMVDKVRALRREMNKQVYGLAGDLIYESEGNEAQSNEHHKVFSSE